MSKKKRGGQAFPLQGFACDGQNNVLQYPEHGMTLRDYFAAAAMQGVVQVMGVSGPEIGCERAYAWADEMLKAREGVAYTVNEKGEFIKLEERDS